MSSPIINLFSPSSIVAGAADTQLDISGAGFSDDAIVLWDALTTTGTTGAISVTGGTALATTFSSATELQATIPAALLARPGAVLVAVSQASGFSSALSLLITSGLDLVTVNQVKAWMSTRRQNVADDNDIQTCISAAGVYWLWRTGRSNADGSMPSTSPFVAPISVAETRDGNGAVRMFLRHSPARSVSLVQIDTTVIAASGSVQQPGYLIHNDGKSIVLRGYTFRRGMQNVSLHYTAGFTGVPFDIAEKCAKMVALTLQRRKWVDQKTQAMPNGAGTVVYRDWELDPDIERVILAYTRAVPLS